MRGTNGPGHLWGWRRTETARRTRLNAARAAGILPLGIHFRSPKRYSVLNLMSDCSAVKKAVKKVGSSRKKVERRLGR
ncbi:DUF3606 domain-containing protein (plasmid) [Bradyrhizobium sp. PMVTL-01]|uniref:DUF3606 domain-containing protein n=1 Tax=Bradyrhizobium sp. PMVTL-01 TaxID=3434999 RepID=UPI003F7298FF